MTEPQQQLIPELVQHPNVSIDVQSDPNGNVRLVCDVIGPVGVIKRLVFPMSAAYAEDLGRKLTAPRVIVAGPGAINGNGRH